MTNKEFEFDFWKFFLNIGMFDKKHFVITKNDIILPRTFALRVVKHEKTDLYGAVIICNGINVSNMYNHKYQYRPGYYFWGRGKCEDTKSRLYSLNMSQLIIEQSNLN